MPVPKRKRSRARRDSRHANKSLKVKVFTKCLQCEHPLPTHQACPECGHYKGVKVLRTKDERAEQRTEVRKVKEAAAKKKSAEANSESENS
jgi:large subunit ribosomal protein L32